MEDRETTGIKTSDGKVTRLTGIGFKVWMALAQLNVSGQRGVARPVSLQQLACKLQSEGRIDSWQTHYDTARWYVWKFKKLGIVKEVDTECATDTSTSSPSSAASGRSKPTGSSAATTRRLLSA